MVSGGVVVADLHGDGCVCVCRIRCGKRLGETGKGSGSLVGDSRNRPALPVKGAITEVRDLRRERRVDVQDVFRCQAEA